MIPQEPYDGYAAVAVLLDMECYTAAAATSTGLRIQVTFRRAVRPPYLSHLCVHCPGLEFCKSAPHVVATDADLVLLLVPVEPDHTNVLEHWDYFIYRPRAQWLELISNPHPKILHGSATAIVGLDAGSAYVVAAAWPVYHSNMKSLVVRWEFDLQLYNSSNSEEGWITKLMSVDELLWDKQVAPLPNAIGSKLYHENGKTITIGGEHGTVAWVDLWHGVFLCDMLADPPVLHDVPLPMPVRGNWGYSWKNMTRPISGMSPSAVTKTVSSMLRWKFVRRER